MLFQIGVFGGMHPLSRPQPAPPVTWLIHPAPRYGPSTVLSTLTNPSTLDSIFPTFPTSLARCPPPSHEILSDPAFRACIVTLWSNPCLFALPTTSALD
ncbi:hypothetical protein BGY98DRAFT_980600, partial [Russula aff. rugulosa BPL654]